MDWRRYYDDPDTVLKEFEAEVVINDQLTDGNGHYEPDPDGPTWYLTWKHGCIQLGRCEYLSKKWATVQAALFCHLWTIGVSAAEADDISCGYAACHQWFKEIQKVYQLQAIGLDNGDERVILSERLWFSRESAEKCHDDFALTAMRKGLNPVNEVNVLTLELRR